jgi:transposase
MAASRKDPLELKDRALRLWQSTMPRRPIAHVAHELGLNPETLWTWIRQDEADRGERTDRPTTAEVEELRRLRRENFALRRTGEILNYPVLGLVSCA